MRLTGSLFNRIQVFNNSIGFEPGYCWCLNVFHSSMSLLHASLIGYSLSPWMSYTWRRREATHSVSRNMKSQLMASAVARKEKSCTESTFVVRLEVRGLSNVGDRGIRIVAPRLAFWLPPVIFPADQGLLSPTDETDSSFSIYEIRQPQISSDFLTISSVRPRTFVVNAFVWILHIIRERYSLSWLDLPLHWDVFTHAVILRSYIDEWMDRFTQLFSIDFTQYL